jgi:hypothetical protein
MQAVMAIGDEVARPKVVILLAEHVARTEGASYMSGLVEALSRVRRESAFAAAKICIEVIGRQGGASAVAALHVATNDVCQWYP